MTRAPLELCDATFSNSRVKSGWLVTADGSRKYPIRNFVPRFVPEANYADNFGIQWNKFRVTQLDSNSGHPISAARFWGSTGWKAEDLTGHVILDAGCGSGRFAEIALGAGARVIAIDYSSAVDACFANLGHLQIDVLQADIFALPFHGAAFSFVYSLGVLQHTPDPKAAFMSLVRHLAPAGRICVDLYERKFPSTALPKYWLRPITKRMPKGALFKSIEVLLPALLALSAGAKSIPLAGRALSKLVPVADYSGLYPLTARQRKEWALLDTFDWLSPTFDYPQSAAELALWFTEAGLVQREVVTSGHLVGRGRKSDANWN